MTASIYQHFSERELALLQKRAERAAKFAGESQKDEFITTLVVNVGGEKYALPIDAVANAYEEVPITPIPHAPSYVSGLANLRGHIMLVVNLGKLLAVPSISDEHQTLIVVADETLEAALAVDYIAGVETTGASSLAPMPEKLSLPQAEHLKGIMPDGSILLNIEAVLNELVASSN